jgi:toxin ParE1/3/4
MSARRRQLIIRPDAQADVRAILLYTRKRWSSAQRDRYRNSLRRAMESLREFPESGPTRDEIAPGCRILTVEQHILYYRFDEYENAIVVGRVLHGSQDPRGRVRF